MSEYVSDDSFFETLKTMEASIEDPLIVRVVERAKEYGGLLQEETAPAFSLSVVEELNQQWELFRESSMLVTGLITFDAPDGTPLLRYVDETKVISDGFTFSDTLHPLTGERHRRIRHFFYLPSSNIDDDYDDEYIPGFAELDDIVINPSHFSTDRAHALLSDQYPGLMDDIDEAAMSWQDSEVGEHFMALQQFELPQSIGHNLLGQAALKRYLSDLFPIDRKLPYALQLAGTVQLAPATDRSTLARLNCTLLADVCHFTINPANYANADSKYGIGLSVDIHPSLPHEEMISAIVPLSSVVRAESLRKKYMYEEF